LLELIRERRVVRRGQHLQKAEPEFREPVRRAGGLERAGRVGVGLHIDGGDAKAKPLELRAGRREVMDEVADVIDEHLVAFGELALGPAQAESTVGQSASSSGTIQLSASAPLRHSPQAGSAIMVSI